MERKLLLHDGPSGEFAFDVIVIACGLEDRTFGASSAYDDQASQLVDARNRRGLTALHVAASQGHGTMAKALVEGGASSLYSETVRAFTLVCHRRRLEFLNA